MGYFYTFVFFAKRRCSRCESSWNAQWEDCINSVDRVPSTISDFLCQVVCLHNKSFSNRILEEWPKNRSINDMSSTSEMSSRDSNPWLLRWGAMFHQLGYEVTQLREGRFAGLQKGLDEISENIHEVRISPFEVTWILRILHSVRDSCLICPVKCEDRLNISSTTRTSNTFISSIKLCTVDILWWYQGLGARFLVFIQLDQLPSKIRAQ